MWVRLRAYARAFRALAALGAAVGLAIALFAFQQANVENRTRVVHMVTSTLWTMSELHFESQRLATSVEAYRAEHVDLAAMQLRFDILWSRIEVAGQASGVSNEVFAPILGRFLDLLKANDPLVFGPSPPSDAALEVFVEDLTVLINESRQLWTRTFGTQNPLERFENSNLGTGREAKIQWLVFVLIALLLVYVLAEVYFANRSQRKEAALRFAAAEANSAKTRFLANVSHEIRTPLNGILGMASELSETKLNADQSQCLRVIEQSGTVLLGTINDVLDLSRIESGSMEVEQRPFAIRGLTEAACALYSARAREKSLSLVLDIPENFPPVLQGDELRLRQVLHNLIANAIKFTATGGVKVRVRAELGGARLSIAVQDTGPGIERLAQERIFEPFLQADTGVTRRHGGTGLGLSISRQLCRSMGGDLTVVSRPGHGATFFCDLPLVEVAQSEVAQPELIQPKLPELENIHLLIADDNATNRLILSRFLAKTGAQLVFAENGEEAIEALDKHPFDAILMDVQMPVLDGVSATQIIREKEKEGSARPVPIIAVTANVMNHQVAEYRAAGMDDVLAKPVSKREVLRVLAGFFPQGAQPPVIGEGTG